MRSVGQLPADGQEVITALTTTWRNYGEVLIENGDLLNDFAREMSL